MKFRCIPSLVMKETDFVKGQNYKQHKYVGDPNNVLKIFNDNYVHEIAIVNPYIQRVSNLNLKQFEKVFSNCFLPISYGGGLQNLDQVRALNKRGVEKFIIEYKNNNNGLVDEIGSEFGVQAVMLHAPFYKYSQDGLHIRKSRGLFRRSEFVSWARINETIRKFGEVIFTDIRREGTRSRVDSNALKIISQNINSNQPILYQGGIRDHVDLKEVQKNNFSGALVGAAYIYASKNRSVNVGYFNVDM